jgi:hypothetical protein
VGNKKGATMRNAFITLSFLILVAANASMACSVYVDNNAQKTILKNLAASALGIPAASISSVSISGYSRTFGDENPESLCPESLSTQATITFNYQPSKKSSCVAQTTVYRDVYIGDDPSMSFETVAVEDSSASCSTSRIAVRMPRPVRPVRLPPVRPVRP